MAPLPKPNAYNHRPNGSAAPSSLSANAATTTNGHSHGTIPAPTTSTAIPTYARTNPYGGSSSTGGIGGGYGGGYGGGGGGYGGGTNNGGYFGAGGTTNSSSSGMRQRRPNHAAGRNNNQQQQEEVDAAAQVQAQIQQRQQQRQTQNRLQEAQQAERTLAELGTMFTKMTSLVSQQGEMLEKIEDDVEAGLDQVIGGQQEITKLYSIKKGNRPLIIKTFSILIFLIIFMKAYSKK